MTNIGQRCRSRPASGSAVRAEQPFARAARVADGRLRREPLEETAGEGEEPLLTLRERLERAQSLEDIAASGTLRRRDTFRSVGLAFTDGVCTFTDLTPGTYVVRLDGGARHAEVQREVELAADAELVLPVAPRRAE